MFPFVGNRDGTIECLLRDSQQSLHAIINDAYRHRRGRISDPAVSNHSDIQLYDVAILNAPLAGDPMNDFIIQRDADVARINPVPQPIAEKGTLHSRFRHHLRSRFVDFLGGDSGSNQLDYTLEDIAGDAAGLAHFLCLLRALDRNHFDSISREMSLKTVSRSRFPS